MNVAISVCVVLVSLAGIAAHPATITPFAGDDWRIVFDYDFDEVVNETKTSKRYEPPFHEALSCFCGDMLYVPAQTNGVMQISSSSAQGYLAYTGEGATSENTLFLFACKLTTTKKVDLAVDCVLGGETNNLAVINLDVDNMSWSEIGLEGVGKADTLLFRPDESARDSRILIDRIVFARKLDNAFYIIIK